MQAARQHYWRDTALPFAELRSTFDSVQNYKPHFHSELSFGALVSGGTRAWWGEKDFTLDQGDLIIIPPHLVHACNAQDGQPRSYHMLFLDADWCVEHVSAFGGRPIAAALGQAVILRDPDLFARYLEVVANLATTSPREIALQISRLLSDVLMNHDRAPDAQPPASLARRIAQALLDAVEQPPTLDELAHTLNRRKETLIRAFRRQYHTTPYAFLNSARVEVAKQRVESRAEDCACSCGSGLLRSSSIPQDVRAIHCVNPGQYPGAG